MCRQSKKKSVVFMYFCISMITIFSQEQEAYDLFTIDFLYPLSLFSNIESCCRELWSDLDLFYGEHLRFTPEATIEHLDNSFLLLQSRVNTLLASDEALIYLPEDITYLLEIITVIEHKAFHILHLFEVHQ